ncbi:MAG: hypothetical protein ACPLPR_00055 [Bacillota bacterium]
MVYHTQKTIALRCASCGKMEFHHLNLFEIAGQEDRDFACSCGRQKLLVGLGDSGIWMIVNCLLCEEEHLVIVPLGDYLKGGIHPIYCPETGAEIAFFGERTRVIAEAENGRVSLESLAAAAEQECIYESPEIMVEVLKKLDSLATHHKLRCSCGNRKLEMRVGQSSVRVYCPVCGQYAIIQAVCAEDVQRVKKLRSICLGQKETRKAANKRRKLGKGESKPN